MEEMYGTYADYAGEVAASGNLINFKSHPNYVYMLEHVLPQVGQAYLDLAITQAKIPLDDIKNFCLKNDAIGTPNLHDFPQYNLKCSSTSLRYVFHAHLILSHIKSLDRSSADIVELGGGYGGLAFAIHTFASKYDISITSYTIIDLPSPSKLQSLYLNKVLPDNSIRFLESTNFGAEITNIDNFLISCYCFSEIAAEYQDKYMEVLFPKVQHGFFTWNFINFFDFGKKLRWIEDEYPMTGNRNKYVYF